MSQLQLKTADQVMARRHILLPEQIIRPGLRHALNQLEPGHERLQRRREISLRFLRLALVVEAQRQIALPFQTVRIVLEQRQQRLATPGLKVLRFLELALFEQRVADAVVRRGEVGTDPWEGDQKL